MKVFGLILLLLWLMSNMAQAQWQRNFEATVLPPGVVLKWQAFREATDAYFEIEKSIDDNIYYPLALVEAEWGGEEEIELFFLDIDVGAAMYFYRLKILDINGNFKYLPTISVSSQLRNNFMVVSMSDVMITDDVFDIEIEAREIGYLQWKIKKWGGGNWLAEDHQTILPGINSLSLDFQELAGGTYKVHLLMDEEEEVLTVEKIPVKENTRPVVSKQ